MIHLPESFKNLNADVFGKTLEDFEQSIYLPSPISIRLNPLKPSHGFESLESISWTQNGYYLDQRISFTLDPYFHGGHYYVQEASSMILDYVIRKLGIKGPLKILDACAAPGGKSSLLCDILGEESFIHCHEYSGLRAEILRQNMLKWSYPHTLVSKGSIQKLNPLKEFYDFILIDAPCSGEGMFRKETEALNQWNLQKVHRCHSLQNELISECWPLLKKGGYLIYSTCTFNVIENENTVLNIFQNKDAVSLQIPEIQKFNVQESKTQDLFYYRCFPHKIKGEGFSFTVLKKTGNEEIAFNKKGNRLFKTVELPEAFNTRNGSKHINPTIFVKNNKVYGLSDLWLNTYEQIISTGIQVLEIGIPLGQYKGKDWIPNHGVAMASRYFSGIPRLNLSLEEARNYLRGGLFTVASQGDISLDKWCLACFNDVTLGWASHQGQRFKNYYPKEFRIKYL